MLAQFRQVGLLLFSLHGMFCEEGRIRGQEILSAVTPILWLRSIGAIMKDGSYPA